VGATSPRAPDEAALREALEKGRGRGDYDCGVLCSGGVDSTAALWLMVRRYGARPLALTLDHGLVSEGALANLHRAAELLEIDHVAFADDTPRRIAATMLERGDRGPVCQACAPWFLETALELAGRFGLPLLVTGWTDPQLGPTEPGARAICGVGPGGSSSAQAAARVRIPRKLRRPLFAPLLYHPAPAGGWRALLEGELGWRPPLEATPDKSTHCLLARAASHPARLDPWHEEPA
jgi:hypothetical protein